jgi:hypothetical protein
VAPPAAAKKPAGQLTHEVAPDEARYKPALQAWQTFAPVALP